MIGSAEHRDGGAKSQTAKSHLILGFDFSCINFSGFGAVRGTDDTISFHLLDHSSRTIISYPQSPLNHRYRRLLSLGDDGDGLVVHLIVFLVGRGSADSISFLASSTSGR